jgi:uncharacterized membrane protein
MNISWIAWVFLIILMIVFAMIGYMLISLNRRGDERSQLIKTKAMSMTFIGTVLLLLFETLRTAVSRDAETSPMLLLAAVSLIYLVALIAYKRKYGDLG